MKIDIIIPYKEVFSSQKASAVSLTIKNSSEFSIFKKYISVFGQFTENPFKDISFKGIKINKFFHFGKNNSILTNYFKLTKTNNDKKIIEIHNRPYLFNKAIRVENRFQITLHFHNDPRDMKGSKSIKERIFIAKNAPAVYFVSEYIKSCFLDGISESFENLYVIPNAIQRTITKKPIKVKEIIFVGRLVPEKGCHLYVGAIRNLVKAYPEWNFKIIGTPKAGQQALNTKYSKKLIKDFNSLGSNTKYLGFISNTEVKEILLKSSILVVPSIWQEPFALTALEGICSGSAVIASKVGGMKEMLEGLGMLIDDIDEIKLKESIQTLLQNKKLLTEYQNRSWQNYQYNQTDIVKKQDAIRKKIFKNFNFNLNKKIKSKLE